MSDDVQHFLLTRVNVSKGFGGPDNAAATPVWLNRQLELFEGLALPSIRAQTSRDFSWILMASDETPEPYRQRIESYGAVDRTFVHFVGAYSWTLGSALVTGHLDPGARRLLTSRIDTDDVVAPDFLATIRDEARQLEHSFVNWDSGYRFDLSTGRMYQFDHRSNMFISLIEPVDGPSAPLTNMGVAHTRAARTLPVHRLRGPRKWIQVIHDQNKSSQLGEHARVSRRVLSGFTAPLLEAAPKPPAADAIVERLQWESRRARRRASRMLKRRDA